MSENERKSINLANSLSEMTTEKRRKFMETTDAEYKDNPSMKEYCKALIDVAEKLAGQKERGIA